MVNFDSATFLPVIGLMSAAVSDYNAFPYDPGFDIKKVAQQAQALPSHSWEFGTAAEALLELYNPELSVFGATPFPVTAHDRSQILALDYAGNKTVFGTGYAALSKGNGAAGDPASLGVSAVMLGKTNATFADAANQTVDGLLNDVPRFWNGAISHRFSVAELWADFMYMVPPFLSFYAADQEDTDLLEESVHQCGLYRQVLQANNTGKLNGTWSHIVGPESADPGLWATGNAWAAAGMTRVLATVMKAPTVSSTAWRQEAMGNLTDYIQEIVDGARNATQDGGLLRNYLDNLDTSGSGFGEISGSSLLAATVYRMALLQPLTFGETYIAWADDIRATLAGNNTNNVQHITATGIATPAVNPLNWKDTKPFTTGSPEGQAFVVLMYTAWRDCVQAGVCEVSQSSTASNLTPAGSSLSVDFLTKRKRDHNKYKRRLEVSN